MSKNLLNLDDIELHFLLAKDRTGSTLLSRVAGFHYDVVAPIEEPFLLFLAKKYKNKVFHTIDEINLFIEDLILFSELNNEFDFYEKKEMEEFISPYLPNLNYLNISKLVYLYGFRAKDLSKVKMIIDKQLKYLVLINYLLELCPDSKYVILVRSPLDNVATCRQRGFGSKNIIFQSARWLQYYGRKTLRYIHSEKCLVVRYEDFVSDPGRIGADVSGFYGFKFNEESVMVSSYEVKNLIDQNEDKIKASSLERLQSRNKSLNEAISTSKIGMWKTELTSEEQNVVLNSIGGVEKEWGYKFNEVREESGKNSVFGGLKVIQGSFRSRWALEIYMKTPFIVRRFIKVLRKRLNKS